MYQKKRLPDERDDDKFYCIKSMSDWLIYNGHLPLFGRTQSGMYVFVRTEAFNIAFEKAPIHLRILDVLKGGG